MPQVKVAPPTLHKLYPQIIMTNNCINHNGAVIRGKLFCVVEAAEHPQEEKFAKIFTSLTHDGSNDHEKVIFSFNFRIIIHQGLMYAELSRRGVRAQHIVFFSIT